MNKRTYDYPKEPTPFTISTLIAKPVNTPNRTETKPSPH